MRNLWIFGRKNFDLLRIEVCGQKMCCPPGMGYDAIWFLFISMIPKEEQPRFQDFLLANYCQDFPVAMLRQQCYGSMILDVVSLNETRRNDTRNCYQKPVNPMKTRYWRVEWFNRNRNKSSPSATWCVANAFWWFFLKFVFWTVSWKRWQFTKWIHT